MSAAPAVRVRYPLRAIAAVVLAALFFLGELILLALCMMPLIPLVPVFVTVMIGQAFLLSSVVEWAASLAKTKQVEPARAAETSRRERHAPKAVQAT